MTASQCRAILDALGQAQGTSRPRVRVDFGGTVFRGRVARADTSTPRGRAHDRPLGVLVLQAEGRREKEAVLQIAGIPADGIRPLDE